LGLNIIQVYFLVERSFHKTKESQTKKTSEKK